MKCVKCGAKMAPDRVCGGCGTPATERFGKVQAGSLSGGRRRRWAARIVGVTFVVILNLVALFLAIEFVVVSVTQGSPAQDGADYVPLWATVVVATICSSVPAITVVWLGYEWRRARKRRIGIPDSRQLPPGCVTICTGQGLYLRADETGLLVRNFYFGRASRIRIAWTAISHFADGAYTKEGATSWMLVIVLRTGKQVKVLSSVLGPPSYVVAAVKEASQRHGIPADLAGVPMKNRGPHQRGLYEDPGGQAGVRYWDGAQWSPLLPRDVGHTRAVQKSERSWSTLPIAEGHWTYPATQANSRTVLVAIIAAASAAMLAGGLAKVLWWDGALHHKDPTNSGWFFVCCGGLAALFVLKAWGSRKFFLRLDEAGKSRVESWQ